MSDALDHGNHRLKCLYNKHVAASILLLPGFDGLQALNLILKLFMELVV